MDISARTAEQIGEAIRRVRKARGWTQGDISARTNLRVATISSLENGDAGTQTGDAFGRHGGARAGVPAGQARRLGRD